MTETWVGIRHRAAGSPSVYFGPFGSKAELDAFAIKNDMFLVAVCLTDPNSDPKEWWN